MSLRRMIRRIVGAKWFPPVPGIAPDFELNAAVARTHEDEQRHRLENAADSIVTVCDTAIRRIEDSRTHAHL